MPFRVNYSRPKATRLDMKKVKQVEGAAEFLAAFPKPAAKRKDLPNPEALPKRKKGLLNRLCGCCRRSEVRGTGFGFARSLLNFVSFQKTESGLWLCERNL